MYFKLSLSVHLSAYYLHVYVHSLEVGGRPHQTSSAPSHLSILPEMNLYFGFVRAYDKL